MSFRSSVQTNTHHFRKSQDGTNLVQSCIYGWLLQNSCNWRKHLREIIQGYDRAENSRYRFCSSRTRHHLCVIHLRGIVAECFWAYNAEKSHVGEGKNVISGCMDF